MNDDNKKPESLETLEDPGTAKAAPKDTSPGAEIKPDSSQDESLVAASPELAKPSDSGTPKTSKKTPIWRRLRELSNLYLLIFLAIVAVGVGTIIFARSLSNNSSSGNKKTSPLTSQQLSQLQGNTTIIGDTKQTLDIQSNTVLEGQLLVRKNLDVAGSLKVGGGLSLSSVTVGGQGSFGQLQINGTLSVSGNTTFSGLLSVQKNLNVAGSGSFGGNLSAVQLSVSSLQLTGDLQISRHITLGGALPSRSNGGAIGSGGTTSVNGSDTAGTITINTGSSPSAGNLVTINFAAKFNSTPHVVVTPIGSAAAGLQYYVTRGTTSFTLSTANAPPAGSSFSFDYIVID